MSEISLPIRVDGTDAVAGHLLMAQESVRKAVFRAVETSAAAVTARAKGKLSDDVLAVRTGRLRRSVHYVAGEATLSAVVGTNVEYAAIHEFGGRTRSHEIRAVNARFLAFRGSSGDMVFRQTVQHPGSQMPERSFLRTALADEASAITRRIEDAIGEALR